MFFKHTIMKALEHIEKEFSTNNESESNMKPELLLITGALDFESMMHLTGLIKTKLIKLKVSNGIISKARVLSTEIIQNVFKHGHSSDNSYFAVYIDSFNQQITLKSGNLIEKGGASKLSATLDKFSSIKKENLKDTFICLMKKSVMQKDDNAGLGLISMFYKSNGLVDYKIKQYDKQFDYFSLQVNYKY